MKKIFPYLFFLGAVVALIASVPLSHDPREQTVFLERFAAKIERAQRIPPETERSVREMIVSVRRNAPKPDSELANRQKLAIQRIEGALMDYTATVRRQDAPTVLSHKDATTVRQQEAPTVRQPGATTVRQDQATTVRKKDTVQNQQVSQ